MRAMRADCTTPRATAGSTRERSVPSHPYSSGAVARDRKPAELHPEQEDHQEGQQKVRNGDAHQGQDHTGLVGYPVVIAGGDDAGRDSQHHGDHGGEGGEEQGGLRAVQDCLAHRLAQKDRLTEVALEQAKIEAAKLDDAGARPARAGGQSSATSSAEASGPAMTEAGSPGARWISTNATVATTSATGRRASRRRAT